MTDDDHSVTGNYERKHPVESWWARTFSPPVMASVVVGGISLGITIGVFVTTFHGLENKVDDQGEVQKALVAQVQDMRDRQLTLETQWTTLFGAAKITVTPQHAPPPPPVILEKKAVKKH